MPTFIERNLAVAHTCIHKELTKQTRAHIILHTGIAELSVAGCWSVPAATNTFRTEYPTMVSSLVRRHLVYIYHTPMALKAQFHSKPEAWRAAQFPQSLQTAIIPHLQQDGRRWRETLLTNW